MALRKPRVLLAVPSLSAGGAERVVSELGNLWTEKGWTIAILTLAASGKDQYPLNPGVERVALDLVWHSFNIWQTLCSTIQRSCELRRAVLQFAPDIVISFIEQTNVRMLAALLGTRIPIIVSERTDPRQRKMGQSWQLARRALYPLAQTVVVQTDSVADWAKSFLPSGRVRVIPNFVPALPNAASGEQRGSYELLSVGRLSREKGFDLLLRAFAHAGLMRRKVHLTILGEGPERQPLESLARELGIAEVVSLPGIVQDPERWMADCTLFVLPSRFEGFPNALLEAMAMGCAVIAADCPSGPRDLIQHKENGLLVPSENVEALAGALSVLIDDANLRQRLGDKATEVRKRYARRVVIGRWEELISSCIGERHGK